MTEFSQLESSQFGVPETPVKAAEGKKIAAEYVDWLFVFLVALAILALIAALAVGLLLVLDNIIPGIDLQFFDKRTVSSAINVPNGWPIGPLLMAGLLFLTFAFYMVARWRILHNQSLWPAAGCPSCHEHSLLRVHRNSGDRVASWMGISAVRYQCRDCSWNGLRIHRGSRPSAKSKRLPAELAAVGASSIDSTDSTQSPGQTWDEMAISAVINGSSEVEEGTPDVEEVIFAIEEPTVVVEESNFAARELTANGTLPTVVAMAAVWPGDEPAVRKSALAEDRGICSSATRCEIVAPFGLNLREAPHSDGALVDVLEPGTNVQLLDEVRREEGAAWRLIQVNDQKGWVLSSFLKHCK